MAIRATLSKRELYYLLLSLNRKPLPVPAGFGLAGFGTSSLGGSTQ